MESLGVEKCLLTLDKPASTFSDATSHLKFVLMENQESDSTNAERVSNGAGGIVTARGTSEGLVIRLDGRVDPRSLKEALNDFMISRRAFLSGNEVSLEWVGYLPDDVFVGEVSGLLGRDFGVVVKGSQFREQQRFSGSHEDAEFLDSTGGSSVVDIGPDSERRAGSSSRRGGGFRKDRGRDYGVTKEVEPNKGYSLFDGIEAIAREEGLSKKGTAEERGRLAANSFLWDDPDARVVYATLRSGQKIESDHTVIVFGDVNSGAEVIAGGDIIVLGTLRGVAHAGAYDETGGGRVIFALNLQPTQLRIGVVISRGSSESNKGSEIARIEGNVIVVEPYQSKNVMARRRD